jgi:class 3 adenylate cyclase/tetratricopeptide (TPR) repeat protein
MARICPSCNFSNPPLFKYCGGCGCPFNRPEEPSLRPYARPQPYPPKYLAEKILMSRGALEGERKQVTVLFADLKGSMELIAERDPEEARRLLHPALERMMAAVYQYEGTVAQVMGDGIMALFGAPLAHEDHAVRACYAALRIQDAIRQHNEGLRRTQGVEVQVRVGLNSGEVLVMSVGTDLQMEYAAVGHTTHLAARMGQIAKSGTILTTRETVNLVGARVRFHPLGPVQVKGLREKMKVYEVRGATAAASAVQFRSIFVGREEEMARLKAALQAAQQSTGQLVVIGGEPGIGKTRLLHEFLEACRTKGCLTLDASAAPYGLVTGYRVGIDILRQYFGVGTSEGPQGVREKVSTKTLTLDSELGGDVPALLWQLGVLDEGGFLSLDLQTQCQQALEANLRLIRREAQRHPVIIALDNLQWVESEAQQMLEGLVRNLPKSTLIVVTHRPEYRVPWMNHPGAIHIRLQALPRPLASAILDDALGNDATVGSLKEFLLERAGGNPLFLEECVHNLTQRGLLAGARGNHRFPGSVATLDIPPSIRSLIEARIDRLPEVPKHVLHCAAVIGQQVPVRILKEIIDLPAEAVLAALGQLRDVGLVDEIVEFPEPSYAFHHALTHDVAYGSLLRDHRRALHVRVLQAMEREYPGDRATHVEQLAHHAMQGEVWGKAAEYLRDSGNKALSSGGSREAVDFLKEALRAASYLFPDPETRRLAIALREDLSRAMKVAGDSSGAVAVLREAAALAEAMRDEWRLARVLSFLSNALWDVGDSKAAIQMGDRAAAIAEELGEAELEAVANFCRGAAERALGDYRRASEYLRRNLSLLTGDLTYKTLGLAGLASVLTRGHLAWSLAELGEFDEARQCSEEALRLAQVADHPYSLTHAHLAMGGTLVRQGRVTEAMGILERGLELSRGVPFLYPPLAADLAFVYALSGRTGAAVELATQAVIRAEESGRLGRLSLIVTHLGEVLQLDGQSEAAMARARWALELARERGELGNQVYALHLSGLVAAEQETPDFETAKQHYGEALQLAEQLVMKPLLARCHLGLGQLFRRLGQAEAAEPHLATASRLFGAMGMTFWLGRLAFSPPSPPFRYDIESAEPTVRF